MGMPSVGPEANHPGHRHSTISHFVLAVHGTRLESPRNPEYALGDKNRLFDAFILMAVGTTRNH